MLKLKKKENIDLDLYSLKDGQIAEIISWGGGEEYNGRIVQRYREDLVTLGAPSGESWFNFFNRKLNGEFLVRVLKKGTALTVD